MRKMSFWLFGLMITINLIFNTKFQLHYDELYYWVWGQNLSLSYYDHPPLVAYLSRVFSYFGHNEFWVRFPALLTTAIGLLFIYKLTKRMFDKSTANLALILALICPMYSGTFFLLTPDSPFLMCWAITLYYFYRAAFENKRYAFYLAGIFAGFALLSKYIAILIFPSLFLFLITSKSYRKLLLKFDIYAAFLLSWLIFLPVIIWNYEHQWVSFLYQYDHGMKSNQTLNVFFFLDYLGGQLLISGPILFIALCYFVIKYFKINLQDEKLAFLLFPCIVVFIFFAMRSLLQHMEANWAIVAYVSGLILLAYWLNKLQNKWVYRSQLIFIFIILVLAKFPLSFIPQKYEGKLPAINVFFGGKETLSHVPQYLQTGEPLLACDYGNASRAWFYLHMQRVYVLSNFKFANNYKYWNADLQLPIDSAIYICDNDDQVAFNFLKGYFKTIDLLEIAQFNNKATDRVLYIYRVKN